MYDWQDNRLTIVTLVNLYIGLTIKNVLKLELEIIQHITLNFLSTEIKKMTSFLCAVKLQNATSQVNK